MATPSGVRIELTHTNELVPGDQIYMEFPFASGGYIIFGSDETFTVTESGPNGVTFVNAAGEVPSQIPMPIKGSRAELLSKLQEKTSIDKLEVYRIPQEDMPPPGIEKYLQGFRKSHVAPQGVMPGMKATRQMKDGYVVGTIANVEASPVEHRVAMGPRIFAIDLDYAPPAAEGRTNMMARERSFGDGRWTAWESIMPVATTGNGVPWMTLIISAVVITGVVIAIILLKDSGDDE